MQKINNFFERVGFYIFWISFAALLFWLCSKNPSTYVITDDNGCQYLSTGFYMTPRLDKNSKQICEKEMN